MPARYRFVPLRLEHRTGMLDMISTAFSEHDPLARSQHIEAADFRNLIEEIIDQFYDLSWLAVTRCGDEVAAVVLAEANVGTTETEGSDAIAALINSVRQAYFRDALPPPRMLDIHFVACAEQHRRQGLVVELVNRCLEAAREKGFRRVIVEASNRYSRNLFGSRLGFDEKVLLSYADFRYQGDTPFASIAEHEGMVLLEKNF